jgi:hypothetical protein
MRSRRLLLLLLLAGGLSRAAGPLAIISPTIAQSDGGSPLPAGFTHVPGEVLFFSFQVEGYKASSADKIRLTYRLDAFDPNGVRILEPIADVIEASLAPEDKNWKPSVHHEIPIPPLADSGNYKIAVTVADEIGKGTASKEVTFEVRGRRVDPSDTLVIRNFSFFRGEQDTEPLQKPAYRPGDAIWARFDITGYKLGEGNAVDVSYGVTVIAPSGKVLYSQPEAAVEKSQSFYPKRYVPGAMSLETKKDTRPGEYEMVITAHDRLGNQTCEARRSFTVE